MLPALVTLPSVTAFYWGYERMKGNPVRAALIGAGGQGRSHIESVNPDYVRIVAFSDIRPSNQKKARHRAGSRSTAAAAREIELIEDYHKLLDRDDIEMVIIALPLHLHARGQHRGHGEGQARAVREADGEDRRRLQEDGAHGRARRESCSPSATSGTTATCTRTRSKWRARRTSSATCATSAPSGIATRPRAASPARRRASTIAGSAKFRPKTSSVDFAKYGYKSLDELVRWRLQQPHRRGADGRARQPPAGRLRHPAAGAVLGGKGPVHPEAVSGVGVNSFFTDGREVEDHIFLTYEYPKQVVVTYSASPPTSSRLTASR